MGWRSLEHGLQGGSEEFFPHTASSHNTFQLNPFPERGTVPGSKEKNRQEKRKDPTVNALPSGFKDYEPEMQM